MSTTTDYSFNTPTVGAELDNWGTLLNANWVKTDDLLSGNSPISGIDINSGSIDNAPIGAAAPATGAFTTLACTTISATTSATLEKIICNNITIDGSNIGFTTDDEDLMALANGALTVNGTLETTGNITVTGNIITNGTGLVDGVDVADLNTKLSTGDATDARLKNIFNLIYPVDSIFISTSNADPATIYGGTWTAFGAGRTLVGVGTGTDSNSESKVFSSSEATAGEYNHTLSQAEMNHNHYVYDYNAGGYRSIRITDEGTHGKTFNASADAVAITSGSGGHMTIDMYTDNNRNITGETVTAHNNIQPYITVYMWKRTALAT